MINFLLDRKYVVSILLTFCMCFIVYALSSSFFDAWSLFGVPSIPPYFGDLRTITHGMDSIAQGFDPMFDNPMDIDETLMNYPRVWQLLYYTGIGQQHTEVIGGFVIFSYIMGVLLMLPKGLSFKRSLLLSCYILSPVSLLGMERGNIDLFIFFIVSLSVLFYRERVFSILLMGCGFILKIFPVFAFSVYFYKNKKDFLLYLLFVIVVSALYVFLTADDLKAISDATPRGTWLSYGINVVWMKAFSFNEVVGLIVRVFSYCAFISVFLLFFWQFVTKETMKHDLHADDAMLNFFRCGAAIFLGTFLIGNNYDYRLVFLMFCIPQMMKWLDGSDFNKISAFGMLVIALSFWHQLILSTFSQFSYGNYISFIIDEFSNWMVLITIMYLFIHTLPLWMKDFFQQGLQFINFKKPITK